MVIDKLSGARTLLEKSGLDAVVFFDLFNVRYLCGFTGTDGAVMLSADRTCFTTDSRYTTQARQQVTADEIRQHDNKLDGVIAYLRQSGAVRIGFEAKTLAVATFNQLKERGDSSWEWVPLAEELAPLRTRKGGDEVEALSEAALLNAEAFAEILPQIAPGVSEREISLALEFSLKRRGGEEKAFDFIVASGLRGAMPHGIASEKIIEAGELVTIDFGTRVRGYHSDETVTVAVGEVGEKQRCIFDIVLEAHDLAMAAVRPGMALKEIDAVARDFIAAQGYGEFFGHGLGHGVGLEVHEHPVVSARSTDEAQEGMIITIEPGIYLPDLGGVRIEDTVLVTQQGCRALTRIPKQFRQLPV